MPKLEIIVHDKTDIDEKQLHALFLKACEKVEVLNAATGTIECNMIDDAQMTEINEGHRPKKGPTDVLSFGYLEDENRGPENTLGEIFIASGVATRQAEEKKHSLQKEIDILFVHGLLHICGYLHDTDEQESEMEAKAQEILA